MSLNVENLFVRCDDQNKVAKLVETYLRTSSPSLQPDWGLPSSFDLLLANERRRKLAISPPRERWIAVIESKEVIDFALAQELSKGLGTTILAIQLAETSGAAGFASADCGRMLESRYKEEDDDPLATIRDALRQYKVPFEATSFREAVLRTCGGWMVTQKK